MKRLVILISGRGSNLQAIHAAIQSGQIAGRIVRVISNRPDASGLTWARQHGIDVAVVDHKTFDSREAFDNVLAETIDADQPDFVLLAGFMRILTPGFVTHYHHRLVNIHPSLLPAYPGLDTHTRALMDGVKLTGATVHFVTATLDYGPIIIQGVVPILPQDTSTQLSARVLGVEHQIYAQATAWLCQNRIEIKDKIVKIQATETDPTPTQLIIATATHSDTD